MITGEIITDDVRIKQIFKTAKTIAILGLSPNPKRDSNKVGVYLKEKGYRIIPVRPGEDEILGEKAYASLDEILEPVDIVDVFRNPAQMVPHAEEALRLKPKVFWMQLNIENRDAAKLLTENGIHVVMNRCMKVEHARLFR